MEPADGTKRKSGSWLLAEELSVSVAQTAIFFFLAMFSSNFLRDKGALTEYATQKISGTTFTEFFLTLLAILVVSGVLFFLLVATKESPRVVAIAKSVLMEMPRTISIFGSSILATLLAVGIHLYNFPESESDSFGKSIAIGLLFWLVSFVYSFSLKRVLAPYRSEASTQDIAQRR
jgi:hypothetical protein